MTKSQSQNSLIKKRRNYIKSQISAAAETGKIHESYECGTKKTGRWNSTI